MQIPKPSLLRKRQNPDSPPGTATYIGPGRDHNPTIRLIQYSESSHSETWIDQISDLPAALSAEQVSWIDVDGIHEEAMITRLASDFTLHPLFAEDVVNTQLRPQLEEYENGISLVIKMITYDEAQKRVEQEQLSLFLGKGFVLSLQEKPGDVLDSLRNRIKNSLGRIRKKKEDYLFYAIVDVVVDHYFIVLEKLEEEIYELEGRLHEESSQDLLKEIQHHKQELIFLRKAILPLREVMNSLNKVQEAKIFEKKNQVFLRDLQSQIAQVLELMETYREVLSNLYDLHFAMTSHRMNEVMKLLTVVSAIFIPLTFIAGVYGMNFDHMPELHWKFGYFMVWGIMTGVALSLVWFFRRKKWL